MGLEWISVPASRYHSAWYSEVLARVLVEQYRRAQGCIGLVKKQTAMQGMDQASLLLRKQLKGGPKEKFTVQSYVFVQQALLSDGARVPQSSFSSVRCHRGAKQCCTNGDRPVCQAYTRRPYAGRSVTNCPSCCAELTKRPVDGFSAGLVDDSNLFEWQITIMGPPDTL